MLAAEQIKFDSKHCNLHCLSSLQNRDAAQKELKEIRQDLLEKKINLTLTKSQKSLTTLANPENIAV